MKPLASSYLDAKPIKPGENPVIKSTSEFEKVKLATSDLVRPGEEPTVKSTAALESTLPSWLRRLRKAEESAESNPSEATSPDQRMPLGPSPDAKPDTTDDQPDWLPGLEKTVADDEKEVPDWLASLREEKPDTSAQQSASLQDRALNTTGSLSAGVADADWEARLGGEPKPETPDAKPEGEKQGGMESLDWLDSLGTETTVSGEGTNPVAEQDEALHEWLSALPANPPANTEEVPSVPTETENIPEWPASPTSPEEASSVPSEREDLPEWPKSPTGFAEIPSIQAEKENLPGWQTPPQEKVIEPGPTPGMPDSIAAESEIPDWLSNLSSIPATAEEPAEEIVPDWLAEVETNPETEGSAPAAPPASAEVASPQAATGDEIPGWLSAYQAEASAAEQQAVKNEPVGSTPQPSEIREGTGPLPDWLAGIEKTSQPSGSPPALIAGEEGPASSKQTDQEFSLEMPDWISKLNPEQAFEKASAGNIEKATPENLELSELPSWVQAMRPVELVVAETREAPHEEQLAPEQTGPLAGLQGVLPVTPGLGSLRKPPAYTAILQVTENQQRYAAALEKMISGETKPVVAGQSRLTSSRVWRWVITVFLLAAVLLPILTGIPATPASTLRSPETVSAFTMISNLPSNSPVLVVFDYDPSLSGELEAAAAPVMDHLLLQGPRLALISTSPTGPALAERFLSDANASPLVAGHKYQSGQQYVDLGYLAGGPSGVQYFANSPAQAAPFTIDGQEAWTTPPLQGVRAFSDFAAILVLTDNADSGRIWIEQSGSIIGQYSHADGHLGAGGTADPPLLCLWTG